MAHTNHISSKGKKHGFGIEENICNSTVEVDFKQSRYCQKSNIPFNQRIKEGFKVFHAILSKNYNLFDIKKDGGSEDINDGGSDIFDGGNKISLEGTNTIHGTVDDTDVDNHPFKFGPMFFYENNFVKFKEFKVWGNYGSDGSTQHQEYFYQTYLNTGLPVVVNVCQKKGNDPSTTTIQFVIGGELKDFEIENSVNRDNYSYKITQKGLCPKEYTIGELLFAVKENNIYPERVEIETFVKFYLDQVYGNGCIKLPTEYSIVKYPLKILKRRDIQKSINRQKFEDEVIDNYLYLEFNRETNQGTIHLDFNTTKSFNWRTALFEIPDYAPYPISFLEKQIGVDPNNWKNTYNVFTLEVNGKQKRIAANVVPNVRMQTDLTGVFKYD